MPPRIACSASVRPHIAAVALSCLAAPAFSAPAGIAATKQKPPVKTAAPTLDYARDIRPILAKNCFQCHGADEAHRLAGLRLDQGASATAARGGRLAAVTPGKPEHSLALQRILEKTPARRMPPPGSGAVLTEPQIAKLRTWIREGAVYKEHWAFVRPRMPAAPKVRNARWARNPMDRFILARLEAAGLQPSPPADPYTLLRRASIDLRGIPPTPEEVDAFARDKSPDAYEKAVDRFLADPAYGERWARMWLDLARYADSAGYGSDPLRPMMWRYRDWVISAFNRNVPYDQFTTEQLAGDLLPNATTEQRIATAFHRNTMTNTEGGTDDEEWRVAAVKDRVDTTLQVWMGLTAGCAKCHNHKFDPVAQKEYYSLFAFFNQSADNDQGDESPLIAAPTPDLTQRLEAAEAQIAAAKARLAAAPPAEMEARKAELAQLEKVRPAQLYLPIMADLPVDKQRKTFLMVKGNYREFGDQVGPQVPTAFNPLPSGAASNRLGFAQWLLSPENPLTARVTVNRFWAQLFGIGIVETEEDFGSQGELPSHPELLDYLALTFASPGSDVKSPTGAGVPGSPGSANAPIRASVGTQSEIRNRKSEGFGWDMKKLLRYVVTSATYRQSSRITPQLLAKDPRNRLLSRAPRYRLEAEMIRDQALALSGLLSRKPGGPSVFPHQPPGLWQAAFNGQRSWTTSEGEDRYRRGLYTFWRRTVPYPSMAAFDAPSRETCSLRRPRTNTPLQAFVTLNDPVYVEAAQALARRMVKDGGATPEARAAHGLKIALCRPAQSQETQRLVSLYQSELAHYRQKPDEAKALATEPLGPLPAGAEAAEMAAWTVVANVLLNLDAVLTRS